MTIVFDFVCDVTGGLSLDASGATVNGTLVNLEFPLRTGDIIDILKINSELNPKLTLVDFENTLKRQGDSKHVLDEKCNAWYPLGSGLAI